MHAKNRDEAARPFERCIINALLLLDTFMLETHCLDGSNVVREKISCNQVFPLPTTQSDILFTNFFFALILFDNCKVSLCVVNWFMKQYPQILPTTFNYPVMDFALLQNHVIYIFQVTLGILNSKIPKPGSSYLQIFLSFVEIIKNKQHLSKFIFDSAKWENICSVSTADPKYIDYAHKNFVECLLNSIEQIDDSKVERQANQLFVHNPPGWRVEYLPPSPFHTSS